VCGNSLGTQKDRGRALLERPTTDLFLFVSSFFFIGASVERKRDVNAYHVCIVCVFITRLESMMHLLVHAPRQEAHLFDSWYV